MSPVGRPVLDTPTGSDLPTSVRTAARLIRDGSLNADTLAEMCLHRVRAVDPQAFEGTPLLKPVTMSLFGMLNWFYMWFRDGGPVSRREYAALATKLLVGGIRGLT